jgi:hypothetical protein
MRWNCKRRDVECGQARREAPGEPVRFDVAAPHLRRALKPGNRPPKIKRRQLIRPGKTYNFSWTLRLSHTAASACFTYLRLLDFRDSYYVRSGLLDHLSSDGFDYWSVRLFRPPRSFLHWRAFGLGPGSRSLRRFRSLGQLRSLFAVLLMPSYV